MQIEFLLKFLAAAAAKSLQSCPTLCDPIDGSPQGSPSLGLSRQEQWSGLPFPSPMHEVKSESEVSQSSSQGHDFSSGHVWMCELDCEES